MKALWLLAFAGCSNSLLIGPSLSPLRPSARPAAIHASQASSAEELLLEAIAFLKSNEIESARTSVVAARRVCDSNGGPTEEQAALLQLVGARLPPPPTTPPEPTLAEMFPGTTAAPTGKSLVMAGTPSFAELAAKAQEKREAAQAKLREAKLRELLEAEQREEQAAQAEADAAAEPPPPNWEPPPPDGFVWGLTV